DIEVSLPDPLAGFSLPAPPEGEALAIAIRASLALLDGLAADSLVFPLLGAVYRAVLGEAPGAIDLSLHLAGPHGVGKSELAALCNSTTARRWSVCICPAAGSRRGILWKPWPSPPSR